MIVVDSSAILSILLQEPDAQAFANALYVADRRSISAANFVEATIVIESRKRQPGSLELDQLLARSAMEIAPISLEIANAARLGFRLYGKGRHAAGLNFGDCFTYALAKVMGYPVLAKGPEFARTDIDVVTI